jgi:hypothetical protein
VRILYLSSVVPAEVNAGYAVMHRHLRKLRGHALKTVTLRIPQAEGREVPGDPVFIPPRSRNYLRVANRIGKKSFWMEREASRIKKLTRPIIEEFRPDLILTVMISPFFLAAGDLSAEYKLPLALVCHDDFEHVIDPVRYEKDWATQRVGPIYRQAACRLCVGPGMAEHLARRYGGEIGEVLYPIPSDLNALRPERPDIGKRPLKIGFFGELGGNYEPVNALVDVLPEMGGELHLFGHSRGAQREVLSRRKGVKDFGFVPRDELLKHFEEVIDAILIPQGFDEENRLLRETCFPSKLPEATRFGLPLLIVAPPHGSAARWGREHLPPDFVVSELTAASLAKALSVLGDEEGWRRGRDAVAKAGMMFESEQLQSQFEHALLRTSRLNSLR